MGACLASVLLLATGCTTAIFESIGDAGADLAGDAGLADGPPDSRRICDAPVMPSCESIGGTCDPVCQTGSCDWCKQKCSFVPAESDESPVAACVDMGAGTFAQSCSIRASGSTQQSDDCAPGNICLAPIAGASTYCFGLCRSRADCLYAVPCGPRPLPAGGDVWVCDPPFDQCGVDGRCCDPVTGSGCGINRFCYLVDPDPDSGSGHSRTVCELSHGTGGAGSPCTLARDCSITNVCVSNTCQPVCRTSSTCPQGQTCHNWGSEFGYCS